MEIIESPYMNIIADLAKNNKNLTPALQDVIAKFLSFEATPVLIKQGVLNPKGENHAT